MFWGGGWVGELLFFFSENIMIKKILFRDFLL